MTAAGRAPRGRCLFFAMLLGLAAPVHGQIIDARLIPPGALRVAFSPQYQSWDHLFAEDGSLIPLGRYLSADSAGASLFPTVASAEAAVRSITGDQTYRLTLGSMTTRVDADVRRFPFEFSLGIASRLTITATVPIVVTRVNAAIALDSSTANAGPGPLQVAALLAQLMTGITALQGQISSGSSACPGGLAQAQDLLTRTVALRANLEILGGVSSSTTGVPPAVPLAGSPIGEAIAPRITTTLGELASCGAPVSTSVTLSLPTRRLSGADVQNVLSSASFGYDATLPAYSKRPHFGDVELGARFGLVQREKVRLVVSGTARLPTGSLDSPSNLVDIGTGDRQTDVVGAFEAAVEAGRVSLATAGCYTLQLPGQIVRRVTSPTQPIALASTTVTLTRDLGDVLWISAYPALHLSDGFHLYGSISYYRKAADRYDSPATVLEQQTAMRSLSLGGGVSYRVLPNGGGLPIEAGLMYQGAVSGSGGFTPKATIITLYLRAYYHLWGRVDNPAATR